MAENKKDNTKETKKKEETKETKTKKEPKEESKLKKETKEDKFDEAEFLKKVEKAASKGVTQANLRSAFISSLPAIIAVCLLAYIIVPKINYLSNGFSSFFRVDAPVEDHDLTLENSGFLGHTVADFEDAVLGDSEKLKKLEVFRQEISDVASITDTGLFNIGAFTKNQLITYHGTAVYTVDLGKLSKGDISMNEDEKIITIKIPHAVQEEINIPEDQIQFGDTNRGLLAFGDIKMTAEQAAKVQAEARARMEAKLDADDVIDIADRFAILSVWEIYSPVIKGVARDYSLEVVFK